MAQDNSSKLSFTIEESVWLNKGQEIDEVISMSLNPEITIEERNEHVQIKGGLRLHGEYRLVQSNEEELLHSDELTFRSIDEVVQNNDGIGEVQHFFPIDVTIPLNRISNLEDVFVQVESFDYDLPDKSCIQLTADIVISGMSNETQETKDQRESTETIPILKNEPLETFEFDAKVEIPEIPPINTIPIGQENESMEEINRTEEVKFNDSSSTMNERMEETDHPQEQVEVSHATSEQSSLQADEEKEKQQEPEFVRGEQMKSEQLNDSPTDELTSDESEERVETNINIAKHEKIPAQQEEPLKGEQLADYEEEKTKSKPRKNENALYLTKMLSNGEEKFSKLRMCIIQPNESLDMIAERYNISSSQIMRMNRLESERLEEGQILYIPVGKNG